MPTAICRSETQSIVKLRFRIEHSHLSQRQSRFARCEGSLRSAKGFLLRQDHSKKGCSGELAAYTVGCSEFLKGVLNHGF